MIKKFLDKIKDYLTSKNNENNNKKNQIVMPGDLQPRIDYFKERFKGASDVIYKEFEMLSHGTKVKLFLMYIDGMADKNGINENILKPLMLGSRQAQEKINLNEPDEAFNAIKKHVLSFSSVAEAKTYEDTLHDVLSGDTALLIDGHPIALIISTRGWEHRTVGEPLSEMVVRGPQEAFVETLRINTALLRKRLKTTEFKNASMKIGKYTQTDVVVAYIEDLADPDIVEEVKNRLKKINIDGILESNYIEELIEDNPYSPFPQIEHTERPDKVVAALLEGRIAIITDGTPQVLIVPCVFWSFLQSSEDFYERYYFGTFSRILRLFTAMFALLGPSLYVAITTFHQEMLPTPLLISIAGQREGVPFPAIVEAFALEIAFEIMREAGVRLPKNVGQAVSIVGALIIGTAAVDAGLVSPAMVIVVSLTGIASFTIPSFDLAISLRLLRFPLMLAASVFGFYGIMLALLVVLVHLCSLRSFGTPYMSPIAPLHYTELRDIGVRVPWWRMLRRPRIYQAQEISRQRSARGVHK